MPGNQQNTTGNGANSSSNTITKSTSASLTSDFPPTGGEGAQPGAPQPHTTKRKNSNKANGHFNQKQKTNVTTHPPIPDPTLAVHFTKQMNTVGLHPVDGWLLNIGTFVFPRIFNLTTSFLNLKSGNGTTIQAQVQSVNHHHQYLIVEQVVRLSAGGAIVDRGFELMSYAALIRVLNLEGTNLSPAFILSCKVVSGAEELAEAIYDTIEHRLRFANHQQQNSPRLKKFMAFLEQLIKDGRFSGIRGKYQVKTSQTMHDYFLEHCTYARRTSKMDGVVREVATHLFNALYHNCHPPATSSETDVEMG